MEPITIVLGILLIIMAIFLTIAVLMQHGKSHNLSGTIAGGAETFFGKTKGRSLDAMLSKITTVVAVIFVIIVALVYILQPNEPALQQIPENNNIEIVDDLDVEPADDNNAEANVPAEGTDAPVEGEASEPVEGAGHFEPLRHYAELPLNNNL